MSLHLPGPLLLVGAGKMGTALLEGWLRQGVPAESIFVRDPMPPPDSATFMIENGVTLGAPEFPPAVIVLAVKPQIMDEVLTETRDEARPETVILSIAAGRDLRSLASRLPEGVGIVRAMPNTPASVGRAMSVACANDAATEAQRALCSSLLEAVGEVAWIDDEAMMDAVTAVSGSGPAYVFLLAECLADAGVAAGLDPELAARLAEATISGAGELLHRSDATPEELRRNVTSKGGTTEAALKVLMGEDGLEALIRRAVEAAAKRSRELGG